MIGEDIVVTIKYAGGGANGKVRVGVEAPKGIPIHREEIYYKIREQQKAESG